MSFTPWREARFAIAQAPGCCFAYTLETHQERAKQVNEALSTAPGWRPLNPYDERLRTLLPNEEA